MENRENTITEEPDYMTIAEVAKLLRCSTDTVRRHIANGRLRKIEWVDFLNNGKLRATRSSVMSYKNECHNRMQQILKKVS